MKIDQKIDMEFLKLAYICVLMVVLSACTSERKIYCEKLLEITQKTNVQKALESWFDEHFENRVIKENKQYRIGGLFVPGLYTYRGQFDRDLINYQGRMPLVKLINIKENIDGDDVFANVFSVSLAERSRASILVKSSQSEDYGIEGNSAYIIPVNDRIAVYCMSEH